MCTVTFYRGVDEVIITSNRDEHNSRPLSDQVQMEVGQRFSIFYPIDPMALGTWFGCRTDGSVLVLLNGAFEKHFSTGPYKRSRGLILLDILKQSIFKDAWATINLHGVEPFSIMIYQKGRLHMNRWDGGLKHSEELSGFHSWIWSSATLFPPSIQRRREKWFVDFLDTLPIEKLQDDLIGFHTLTGTEDPQNALVMSRDHNMQTKNITQISLSNGRMHLLHWDLKNNNKTSLTHTLDYELDA